MGSPQATVPSSIFHYTGAASLLSIIENRQLWVTDIEFLNDDQESRYAVEKLREALIVNRHNLLDAGAESLDTDRFLSYNEAVLDGIDRRFPRRGGSRNVWERMPYVTSFCGVGDLLSMWRAYAHGPGFAIEFDTRVLQTSLGANPQQFGLTDEEFGELKLSNSGIDAHLLPIEYGARGADRIVKRLFEALEEEPRSAQAADVADRILNLMAADFARVKHPAFAEEHEIRLLLFLTGDLSPRPRLRAAQGHLVPYLPVTFPHEAIRSIRVGPSPYSERSRLALERRFAGSARAEYGHIEVSASEAPLLY
jgi:hypothetical protein